MAEKERERKGTASLQKLEPIISTLSTNMNSRFPVEASRYLRLENGDRLVWLLREDKKHKRFLTVARLRDFIRIPEPVKDDEELVSSLKGD